MSRKKERRERKARKFILREILDYSPELHHSYFYIQSLEIQQNPLIRRIYYIDLIRIISKEFLEKQDNKLIFIALLKIKRLHLSEREQEDIKIILQRNDWRINLYCEYILQTIITNNLYKQLLKSHN